MKMLNQKNCQQNLKIFRLAFLTCLFLAGFQWRTLKRMEIRAALSTLIYWTLNTETNIGKYSKPMMQIILVRLPIISMELTLVRFKITLQQWSFFNHRQQNSCFKWPCYTNSCYGIKQVKCLRFPMFPLLIVSWRPYK